MRRFLIRRAWLLLAALLVGCRAAARCVLPAGAEVLFVGTSLTAGYGLDQSQAFPALLERRGQEERLPFRATNAGISGESSAGALDRIDWILDQDFDVLVLETGANDMLRRQNPERMRQNIQAILDAVREERPDATIVLVGVGMPKVVSPFTGAYEKAYRQLARDNNLPLVQGLLTGVLPHRSMTLNDRIHPNEAGHVRMAENVWGVLSDVLRSRCGRGIP
jgi:acyl-CoA thioesterase I